MSGLLWSFYIAEYLSHPACLPSLVVNTKPTILTGFPRTLQKPLQDGLFVFSGCLVTARFISSGCSKLSIPFWIETFKADRLWVYSFVQLFQLQYEVEMTMNKEVIHCFNNLWVRHRSDRTEAVIQQAIALDSCLATISDSVHMYNIKTCARRLHTVT